MSFIFSLIFEFWVGYVRSWEWPESGCRIRQTLPCIFGKLTYGLSSTLEVRGWSKIFSFWVDKLLRGSAGRGRGWAKFSFTF